jgi:hypothetical protein
VENGADTDQLEALLHAQAAQLHAVTAALAESLARFDGEHGWHGAGLRSIGHWADINLGIAAHRANQLAAIGGRLAELPKLRAAFVEGAVSEDKVRLAAAVATSASDEKFTYLARAASTAQLRRICSAYRRVTEDDSAGALDQRHRRREVTAQPLDDGLVRVVALVEPDEAALVLAALDARVESAWRRDRASDDETPPTELSARRADALVELATEALVEGPDPVVRGERVEVRVHVDAQVLSGARDDGISYIEGIGPVAPAVVRRLLCDARVCTVTEQVEGIFNLGREQRTVSRRQRRALHQRDGGCRFPGCAMRRFVNAHHVVPWDDLGPTDMDNLMLLCAAHHRLFHEGEYRIDRLGHGRFTFRRPDGRVIAPPPLRAEPATGPPPRGTPVAGDGGGRFDLGLTIDALIS